MRTAERLGKPGLDATVSHRRTVSRFTCLQLVASALTLCGLAVMGVVSTRRTTECMKQAICMANLQEIGDALDTYLGRCGAYPGERPDVDWLVGSMRSMTGGVRLLCPCDDGPGVGSYQGSYVIRPSGAGAAASGDFVLGCLRHFNGKRMVGLFTGGRIQACEVGRVQWRGGKLEPGEEVRGGVLVFEDGTTVTLSEEQAARVILSVRQPAGEWYLIVKTSGETRGAMTASVVKGSRLEIATPSAMVSSCGTEFRVETLDGGSVRVQVASGLVRVRPYEGPQMVLSESESLVVRAHLPRWYCLRE